MPSMSRWKRFGIVAVLSLSLVGLGGCEGFFDFGDDDDDDDDCPLEEESRRPVVQETARA